MPSTPSAITGIPSITCLNPPHHPQRHHRPHLAPSRAIPPRNSTPGRPQGLKTRPTPEPRADPLYPKHHPPQPPNPRGPPGDPWGTSNIGPDPFTVSTQQCTSQRTRQPNQRANGRTSQLTNAPAAAGPKTGTKHSKQPRPRPKPFPGLSQYRPPQYTPAIRTSTANRFSWQPTQDHQHQT